MDLRGPARAAHGSSTNPNISTDIQDTKTTLVRITHQPSVAADLALLQLEFEATPAPATLHLTLIEAHDDRGRRVSLPMDAIMGNRRGRFQCGVALDYDAQNLDLRLAVQHSRLVEYLVKPELR